jgi:DNA-binding transcriptional MerR regulator/DNA gyrase inhibitor GyrI
MTTITEATKLFGLSTRTLRYYEQIGLIKSERADDYAYRVYSDDTLNRLRQIIVLRKLRIPLKSISDILLNDDAKHAIDVFMANISEIDAEITALSTIRDILHKLSERLEESVHLGKKLDFLSDDIVEIADTLAVVKPKIKEETSMSELNQASEKLEKLTDRDVRIIYLPPMTVASAHYVGEAPELVSDDMIQKYIKDSNLEKIYPASRHFGFNNPDTPNEGPEHGYERLISISDDMDVPAPLVKKKFSGGLYAAHHIPMGAFDEWYLLHQWVDKSEKYEFRWGTLDDGQCALCGWLEEHLNYFNWYTPGLTMEENDRSKQLDLLIPIKEKV